MSKSVIILECKCGHKWAEQVTLPMTVTAFVKRSKGWDYCPKCSRKGAYLLSGDRFKEAYGELFPGEEPEGKELFSGEELPDRKE